MITVRPARWLRRARLADGARVDVQVVDDKVHQVCAAGPAAGTPGSLDLDGYLLLPAAGEPHAHLDRAHSADDVPNPSGDLAGAVAGWARRRPRLTHCDLIRRATAAAHTYLGHGATIIRSHIDVGDGIGLQALQAVSEVRETLRDSCTIQLVAFVNAPLTGRAGASHRALLRAVASAGADVIGGCPYLDPDPANCLNELLKVAADNRMPIDLHVDDVLDPTARSLRLLADAIGSGYPYGATASHCVSLGAQSPAAVRRLADRLAQAGIGVVCTPQTNLHLHGRQPVPGQTGRPRGLPPLDLLLAAGVTVAAGGDDLQDPFNPLGRGDPLETAALLVLAGQLPIREAYQAVSANVRTVLQLPPATIAPGAPADLLAIRAGSLRAAIADADADRLVLHGGRIVARTTVTRQIPAQDECFHHGGSL